MRNFVTPAPGAPFLTGSATQSHDQIDNRLLCEVNSHQRRTINCEGGKEPNVQTSLDEVRLMAGNSSQISHLLRKFGERA